MDSNNHFLSNDKSDGNAPPEQAQPDGKAPTGAAQSDGKASADAAKSAEAAESWLDFSLSAPPADGLDRTIPLPAPIAAILAPPLGTGEIGRLGNYRILEVLGRGGVGIVFRAQDPHLGRQVAVKALLPDSRADPEWQQRFWREAKVTARIENDHVVGLYHVGEDRGHLFLVLPLLKGMSLDKWLRLHPRRDPRQLARLGRHVATGLAAAHNQGVLHRDIKPSNIWMEAADDRAKILDFGLARKVDNSPRLTAQGYLTGTPAYMSPEQARGEETSLASDLFSLGIVLYEAASGRLPFVGFTIMDQLAALASAEPIPLSQLVPDLPPRFSALVMQLLEKEPARRPSSAQEVARRFAEIEGDLPATRRAPPGRPGPRQAQPPGKPHPAQHAIMAVVLPGNRRRLAIILSTMAAALVLWAALTWIVVVERASPHLTDADNSPTGAHVANAVNAAPKRAGETSNPTLISANDRAVLSRQNLPTRKPIKVFLLAGQSNMEGQAAVPTIQRQGSDAHYQSLVDRVYTQGQWRVREDVWIYSEGDRVKHGPLTIGYGRFDHTFGPELMFGHVMGDLFDNPVFLVKIAQGKLALAVQGRPPRSGGTTGSYYHRLVSRCKKVLAELPVYMPDEVVANSTGTKARGYEWAGLVWFQGWNDHLTAQHRDEYANNLANLIRDLRAELGAPRLPVVIGEFGVNGAEAGPEIRELRAAQWEVVNMPEFQGTIALAPTVPYWDHEAEAMLKRGYIGGKWKDFTLKTQFETMGRDLPFHYLGSGKTMMLIGHRFAETMKPLCVP